MGSACCVAARDHTLSGRTNNEALHRNLRYSPSWSFRWDNRVSGEVRNLRSQCPQGGRGNTGLEIKDRVEVEREDVSDGESPLENFRRPTRQKPAIHDATMGNSTTPASDVSVGSSFSMELTAIAESSAVAGPSAPKLSFSTPSASSISTLRDADPSVSQNNPVHGDMTPSRWARRSPGHQLLRGISDSQILGLKSPNNNSVSEGRQSFVLSACSNDMTLGSQGLSSDGWSMRTFSELVASSQRERWSFDSETLDSGRGKITRSNSRLFASPPIDLKSCGVCSKLLTERSSWSNHKFINNTELSVVAVLVCGHVYHAECLESMTCETDRYDPSCPVCMVGEKQTLKIAGKQLREADSKVKNKWISRKRVVDSNIDGSSITSNHRKHAGTEGKGPKMGASSSMKSYIVKPFLKRHFSLGSKPSRSSPPGNELSVRKKGFWARYH